MFFKYPVFLFLSLFLKDLFISWSCRIAHHASGTLGNGRAVKSYKRAGLPMAGECRAQDSDWSLKQSVIHSGIALLAVQCVLTPPNSSNTYSQATAPPL